MIKNKVPTVRGMLIMLAMILLIRFVTLPFYELYDTTEARYAGVAMRMVTSGDFLTPYISKYVPFLGKPALSFQVTAISMAIFGFNEFAARLPHFLIAVALIVFCFQFFKKIHGGRFASLLCLILASSFGFLVISGAVMTESLMIAVLSLSLLAFWQRMEHSGGLRWLYIFFTSLGINMLVKGPVGVVMAVVPILIYIIYYKKWRQVFVRFAPKHILGGTVLMFAMFLPWYFMAESANPGFLHYFILGEHFNRFLIPGWKGDRYGFAHNEPIGFIWLYFICCMAPWSVYFLIRFRSWNFRNITQEDFFFAICAIFPLIFFTLARNITPAYATFSLMPTSFLMARYLISRNFQWVYPMSCCFIIAIIGFTLTNNKLSDKNFIAISQPTSAQPLYYYKSYVKFSSRFYARDNLIFLNDEEMLRKLPKGSYVVSDKMTFNKIDDDLMIYWREIWCNSKNRCIFHNE